MPGEQLIFAFFRAQENVPNVESFHINNTSIPMSGPVHSDATADTAKSLSTLSVRVSLVYPPVITTPFVRLRTLSVKHGEPYQCLRLLKYCPVLEELNLSFYDVPKIVSLSDDQTILPRFRNFRLSHTGNDEHGYSYLPLQHGGELVYYWIVFNLQAYGNFPYG
ncbi:hypothetical protein BD410DRAFT_124437 [Rickenella mellea]|uniref:F-box domain-containing protein n=1 Tax=Rickenella mellea TaxID=50990 RepID=A0A4Y7PJK0_9AGAM|nr:hypothetical protein BD410DRAFT_124437 [Rickenella mellea]